MKILVVGGAGYIGSHMVLMLREQGMEPVVLDDLSAGYAEAVIDAELVRGTIADTDLLDRLFSRHEFAAVMHFASFIQVGESVRHPDKYYRNNFSNTLTLLSAMVRHGVLRFIFSSTAAIFGEPDYVPLDENHPQRPINPYGRSKLMVEQVLHDYDLAYGLRSVCLRYFNAAGADPRLRTGERHDPETHLIPILLQVASGRRPSATVFGRDYPTADGTCIRDYIHVQDLCSAHALALQALLAGAGSTAYNLGNGLGFSVQQVIDTVTEVSGRPLTLQEGPRRAGDPAQLVADSRRIRDELGWQPQYPDLRSIVSHAWLWEQRMQEQPVDARSACKEGARA